MTLDDYYDWACDDAVRRGLPELKPILDALRHGARQLRDVDWNDDASGGGGVREPHDAAPPSRSPRASS